MAARAGVRMVQSPALAANSERFEPSRRPSFRLRLVQLPVQLTAGDLPLASVGCWPIAGPDRLQIAIFEGGRPSAAAGVAADDRFRSPSAQRFRGRHRPRCPGISLSTPAWSVRAATAQLGGSLCVDRLHDDGARGQLLTMAHVANLFQLERGLLPDVFSFVPGLASTRGSSRATQ